MIEEYFMFLIKLKMLLLARNKIVWKDIGKKCINYKKSSPDKRQFVIQLLGSTLLLNLALVYLD
jgi:hypothetical protein